MKLPPIARRVAFRLLLACASVAAGCHSVDDLLPLRLLAVAAANPGASVGVTSGIVYAQHDGLALHLELYQPLGATTARPLVIVVHGGSWDSGSPADVAEFAFDLAANGYVAAAIEYRLIENGGTFPNSVADLLAALAFLRDDATEFGIDADRVALLGVSAGSNLTLLAGLAEDVSLFDATLPAEQSANIRAVVNIAGPTDFTIDQSTASPAQVETVEAYLGVPLNGAESLRAEASPISYVRADGPAVLTLHGTLDFIVPIDQARRLDAALSDAGQAHQTIEILADHFGAAIWHSPAAQAYRAALLDFLDANL